MTVGIYTFHASMPSAFGSTEANKYAKLEQLFLELGSRTDATSVGMDSTILGDLIVMTGNLVWAFILTKLRNVGYTYAQVIKILGLTEAWVRGCAVLADGWGMHRFPRLDAEAARILLDWIDRDTLLSELMAGTAYAIDSTDTTNYSIMIPADTAATEPFAPEYWYGDGNVAWPGNDKRFAALADDQFLDYIPGMLGVQPRGGSSD